MEQFLDTSIILRSAIRFETYFEKASSIVSSDKWITSNIACEELNCIRDRRNKIYKNVIAFEYDNVKEVPVREVYTRCFKSALGDNRNDAKHIEKLFNHCIEKMRLKHSDMLTKVDLESFQTEIFPVIRGIKIKLGSILHKLDDPTYHNTHVVNETWKTSSAKSLKKGLYKLSTKNKEDIKLIIDATLYSEEKREEIIILTTDGFLCEKNGEIKNLIKKFHKFANIEIKHLKDY